MTPSNRDPNGLTVREQQMAHHIAAAGRIDTESLIDLMGYRLGPASQPVRSRLQAGRRNPRRRQCQNSGRSKGRSGGVHHQRQGGVMTTKLTKTATGYAYGDDINGRSYTSSGSSWHRRLRITRNDANAPLFESIRR